MITFTIQDCMLIIGSNSITFLYPILKVKALDAQLLVILSIPSNSPDIDNIYAVDHECWILWQIQSRAALEANYLKVPYTGISVQDDLILAIDFYGARYFVNPQNGHIVGRDRRGRDW